ncbi:serine kinase [Aureimonas populi]|uniref:Serine kinase n=1 Tax=Aureimonas populi TaxID=1701758 RepID=A0ABW5CR10_9HYPH|nr:serine kinase [Aureimonas populi]
MERLERTDAGGTAPFAYRALGLVLVSDFALAELTPVPPPGGAGSDVVAIRRGAVPRAWNEGSPDPFFRFEGRSHILRWRSVGAFMIADDRTILVDPAEGVDPRLIAFPLLGPVLALLLHRRGRLVLHASAVEIEGRAVVLMGDKGAGKSTLAGALVSAGHRLLTDDVLVLAPTGGGGKPVVEAAAGQLKLHHESRAAISLAGSRMVDADLHPSITKRQHRLGGVFRTDAAPLGALLTLGRGPQLHLERLARAEALQALIRFSYPVRFERSGLGEEGMQRLFRQCADLASTHFVGRLAAAAGLGRLGETVREIEALARRPALQEAQ